MDSQEKNFIQDILKRLLLTKQSIETQYGIQERESIFEGIMNEVRNKFKLDENLVNELQVDFANYIKKNKPEILKKINEVAIEKLGKLDVWNYKSMIREVFIEGRFIEKEIIASTKVQKAIDEYIREEMPDLSKKIHDGLVNIKIEVSLK